jgi:hypothetical protein
MPTSAAIIRHLFVTLSISFHQPASMRLLFLFLFAIAAALSSTHAQTPLVFTSNATLPSSPAGSPASIPVQITGGPRGLALIVDIWTSRGVRCNRV